MFENRRKRYGTGWRIVRPLEPDIRMGEADVGPQLTHTLRFILYAANVKNNAVTPMTYTNINGIVTDKSPRHRSNPISTLKDSTMVDGAPMNVSSSAVCARDPLNNAAI